MTREELIALAKEADAAHDHVVVTPFLERFAALVAAKEREECAKVCEEYAIDRWNLYKGRAPYDGNEEGRADPHVQGQSDGATECEALIRARKP